MYDYHVSGDNDRALAESNAALALAPGNAELLNLVGAIEFGLARWEDARGHLEQAARLDPRSTLPLGQLGGLYLYTRRYPEAVRALDRARELAPTSLELLQGRAMVALAQGDLAGARAIIGTAPKEVDPTTIAAFFAYYWDLGWVLEESQQRILLRLTPSAFDDDRGGWSIVLAQATWLRGDRAMARAYADSARLVYEERVKAAPEDAQSHFILGLALAFAGRKAAAIREGERAVALLPMERAPRDGAYAQHQLARIYLLVGESEKAVDRLEQLLSVPYYLSPGWLKIDPNLAALRNNSRFQRLTKQ